VRKDSIYDVLTAKHWAIRHATEAAISILRVDAIIMSKAAGGPKMPSQNPSKYDDHEGAGGWQSWLIHHISFPTDWDED